MMTADTTPRVRCVWCGRPLHDVRLVLCSIKCAKAQRAWIDRKKFTRWAAINPLAGHKADTTRTRACP